MNALQVILLVAGILAFQAMLWVPILAWVRKRSRQIVKEIRADITAASEREVMAPEPALYNGASGRFPQVKGNAVVALTDKRLVVRRLIGTGFELAVADIAAVREDKWFRRSYKGGRLNVIVKTRDGVELGFITASQRHAAWMQALRDHAK